MNKKPEPTLSELFKICQDNNVNITLSNDFDRYTCHVTSRRLVYRDAVSFTAHELDNYPDMCYLLIIEKVANVAKKEAEEYMISKYVTKTFLNNCMKEATDDEDSKV